MKPFTKLSGIAVPLPMMNVDTDMIIPKQFLKTIKRTGLGTSLFFEHRYDDDGNDNPHFVLNHPHYSKAQILVTGENFGCGSSREHAPWALLDFGIRCIIAPSFADIFFHNCFKNGILPVVVEHEHHDRLMTLAHDIETSTMDIDLHDMTITTADGVVHHFHVDPFRKECLIHGLDDIGLTMKQAVAIDTYEGRQRALTPWLYR